MKNLLAFLLLLSTTFAFVQAQNSDIILAKKNSIAIELYSPVHTNGLRHIYNEDWILSEIDAQSRKYNVFALGIAFEKGLQNNLIGRLRLGVGLRNIEETASSAVINNYGGGEVEKISAYSSFDYQQTQGNLFLGLAKRIKITDRFNFDLGFDLAFIAYRNNTSDYYHMISVENDPNPAFDWQEERWIANDYGHAQHIGIGPVFKPEYALTEKIVLSFEVPFYFLHSFSNDDIESTDSMEIIILEDNTPYKSNSTTTTKINFSQWSWSSFSPLFRVGLRI